MSHLTNLFTSIPQKNNSEQFKFRRLDAFGSMLTFHIRGSFKYQTKLGAILTVLYVTQTFSAFFYYFSKFLSKDRPIVLFNEYDAKEYNNIDLASEDFVVYFTVKRLATGKNIPWEEFWTNFNLYASILHIDDQSQISWQKVNFSACKDMNWFKNLSNDDIQKYEIEQSGICFSSKEMNIYGGNNGDQKRLMVDLYRCQPDSEFNCVNEIEPYDQIIKSYGYENTINVKDYHNPIKNTHKLIDFVIPSRIQRYDSKAYLNKLNFKSDSGNVISTIVEKNMVQFLEMSKTVSDKSKGNVKYNYLSQGRMFNDDLEYHLEFITSNTAQEISRAYFTLLDVFSNVGGLFQFLTVAFYLIYFIYNHYRLYKHTILKVIIGRSTIQPKDYHQNKNFCSLLMYYIFRKIFPCCFGKKYKTKDFQTKYQNLDASLTLIHERMDLKNYINDSMNLYIMKQLMLKSRHKILIPALIIGLTKSKIKYWGGYKTSFSRNQHERTDLPVFTIEDAIHQIKYQKEYENRSEIERNMDDFVLKYLPEDIYKLDEKQGDLDLNRQNILKMKRNRFEEEFHKCPTETNLSKESLNNTFKIPISTTKTKSKNISNKIEVINFEKFNTKKRLTQNLCKSDITDKFIESNKFVQDFDNIIKKRYEVDFKRKNVAKNILNTKVDFQNFKKNNKKSVKKIANNFEEVDNNVKIDSIRNNLTSSMFRKALSLGRKNEGELYVTGLSTNLASKFRSSTQHFYSDEEKKASYRITNSKMRKTYKDNTKILFSKSNTDKADQIIKRGSVKSKNSIFGSLFHKKNEKRTSNTKKLSNNYALDDFNQDNLSIESHKAGERPFPCNEFDKGKDTYLSKKIDNFKKENFDSSPGKESSKSRTSYHFESLSEIEEMENDLQNQTKLSLGFNQSGNNNSDKFEKKSMETYLNTAALKIIGINSKRTIPYKNVKSSQSFIQTTETIKTTENFNETDNKPSSIECKKNLLKKMEIEKMNTKNKKIEDDN